MENKTILVVEDDGILAIQLRNMLIMPFAQTEFMPFASRIQEDRLSV